MTKGKTFICAACRKEFTTAWSDEEAIAERERDFPDFTQEECDVICDDCYQEFNEWMKSNG